MGYRSGECRLMTIEEYKELIAQDTLKIGTGVELENVTDEWYDEEGNLKE